MPRHLKWMDAFIEVWSDEFYEKIKWYNNVLDLGGYIWDSALKLAENNKNVIVYEALTENFKYLQLNTKNHKNIKSYNYAVVWDTKSNKSIKFYGWWFNMWAWTWYVQSSKNFTEVPTKSIIEILKNDDFDALKMDIEWAEYECLDALMKDKKENLFKFKAWFIEFHLGDKFGENMKKTEKIVEWIKEKWYKIKFYDVLKNENVESLDKMKSQVFLVYFNK
jgi:FkbM family methyltransferase